MKVLVVFEAHSFENEKLSKSHVVLLPYEVSDIKKLQAEVAFHSYPEDHNYPDNEKYRAEIINQPAIDFLNENKMNITHELTLLNIPSFEPNEMYKIIGPLCSSTTIKCIIPFDENLAKSANKIISISGEELQTFMDGKMLKPSVRHFLDYCEDMYGTSRVFQLIKSNAVTISLSETAEINLISIDNHYLPDGLTSRELGHFRIYNEYYQTNGVNSVNLDIRMSQEYLIGLIEFMVDKSN